MSDSEPLGREVPHCDEDLAAKLNEMQLHDNTGDPHDEGYMAAINELRDWLVNRTTIGPSAASLEDAREALREHVAAFIAMWVPPDAQPAEHDMGLVDDLAVKEKETNPKEDS